MKQVQSLKNELFQVAVSIQFSLSLVVAVPLPYRQHCGFVCFDFYAFLGCSREMNDPELNGIVSTSYRH
jgi:hypothetical protein